MTPRDADLTHSSRPRVRASSSFTQGNVTSGPRSRQARAELADRRAEAAHRQMTTAPLQSLVASAKRLTSKKLKGGTFKKTTAQGWQEDAWEMFDLVGEQHFLGTTLANQASKANFYVGVLGEGADTTDLPDPAEDPRLQGILDQVGGGPVGFGQMVQRMCINLWVAGDGWLVGIPKQLLPDYEPDDDEELGELPDLMAIQDPEDETQLEMGDLEWRMMSVSEVSMKREGLVVLHLGAEASEKVEVSPDLLYMIRVWRPHPRRWWEADSPTRASLPVLRELVGLTMHISAQVDSRLAGAGMLLVPASAARALKIAAGLPEDSMDDPFTEALMEAMLTPIGDRANASALVPLVVTVPDGTSQDFQYLTFSKPLDTEARSLREESIRRLALGQDAPPEVLLGTAGMNHWGAWLVRDDVVTTHIEPPLALIADALTTQYLRPMMAEMGFTKEQIAQHVIWYDTTNMVVRPNRSADALVLYDRDALSDEALREANGFDETDAPETSHLDLASQTAFQMVKENPGLMANPGLPALVDQIRALLAGKPQPLPKKGSAASSATDDPAAPVGPDGQPIPTSNPSLGGVGGGGAPRSGAAQPVTNTGAPPTKPSVTQGPALAAEDRVSLADLTDPYVSDEEYARKLPGGGHALSDKAIWHVQVTSQFGPAKFDQWAAGEPGRLKNGDAPKCSYCSREATNWVLFAEGMAFIPFCNGHEEDALEDAAAATPSGEPDPSNIDGQGAYSDQTFDASSNPVDDQSDLTPEGGETPQPAEAIVPPTDGDLEPSAPGMQGAIVVLIPAEEDPITQAVRGVDAHLTLAYLAGDISEEPLPDHQALVDQARVTASNLTFSALVMENAGVSMLGDAAVLNLEAPGELGDPLHDLFSRITDPSTPIGQLNEMRNKYEFRPHVSLAYFEGPEDEGFELPNYLHPTVTFDRIGVWIGEEHYDFPLGPQAENETQKLGYTGEDFLEMVERNLENPPVEKPASGTYATVEFMGQPAMNTNFVAPRADRVPESASVVRPLNAAAVAATD